MIQPPPLHECQNCGAVWKLAHLNPIQNLHSRVDPGEPLPSGECPICHCLCSPIDLPKTNP